MPRFSSPFHAATLAAAVCAALFAAPLRAGSEADVPADGEVAPQAAGVEGDIAKGGFFKIGYGRLVTNDLLGDGQDRWRTGSVASSRIYARAPWAGALPSQMGEVIELRFSGEIMAPDNLSSPAAGDRPFAGALSLGAHTHFARGQTEFALGADLVVTGKQTGLDGFQTGLHDLLGRGAASAAVRDAQIGDGIHPTLVFEAGRDLSLGGAQLRPFVEARAGAETLLRVGADMTIGSVGMGELLVRDPVSGQRYRTTENGETGYSFVLGADMAAVDSSIFLPESRGYALSDARSRARFGVHWQGESSSVFYGLTYLGEEFVGQGEGQVLGSLRLNLDF
ncbi:lipid A-modifier LpxR family protein [Litorivita sp. NS0012-18]|uniref:lipid A-modifier LpxR family protein n=1 Tax=Litorivita sp. NS0012-18 TaxID=3127655 RepID=UPI003108ED75